MGPGTERGYVRESPYKTVGKDEVFPAQAGMSPRLNESPHKTVGKCTLPTPHRHPFQASMKTLPKRKGNATLLRLSPYIFGCLNESPSKKEGKFAAERAHCRGTGCASMKALPKRKGKSSSPRLQTAASPCLNESLSGKDGKYSPPRPVYAKKPASMKAPPKRKGNPASIVGGERNIRASMKALPKRKGNLPGGSAILSCHSWPQ